MKIIFHQCAGLTEQLVEQQIRHLLQPFFDTELELQVHNRVEIELSKDEGVGEADLVLQSTLIYRAEEWVATVWLDALHGSKRYSYKTEVGTCLAEVEKSKVGKQALAHALVKVLEEWTGIKQPWGILTGVRPTKLMHRFRLQERTKQEIEQYFTEHLLLLPDRRELLEEIVQRQLRVVPDFDHLDQEVSLYIGIPFCPTKCAYCTFPAYALNRKDGLVEQFLQGLELEIKALGAWLRERQMRITTIYFGGGTPTSIEAEEMERLFQLLAKHLGSLEEVRELTVEAGRPDTITPEKLRVLKKWQVDRISINPQSFTQATLDLIGRHHSVEETLDKFAIAREFGFNNINMDLIIGLPGEGLSELQHSLEQVSYLRPESLTIHTLSFKRAATMTKNKGKYLVAEQDELEQMMALASSWTAEEGYQPYYLYRQKNILGNLENIGYSLAGKESIYNIMIMEEAQTIIGLGCGAVSKLIVPGSGNMIRWPNPKEPQAYISTYEQMIEEKIGELNKLYDFSHKMLTK